MDYRGIAIDTSTPKVTALDNMSADNKEVLFSDKGVIHNHGYLTLADKDGDKMVWELWDVPGGKNAGKIVTATGKFTGMEGTSESTVIVLTDFKDGPWYVVGHCVEKLTFKAPL